MNATRPARADDHAAASEVEGEIREFIRRDIAHLRKPEGDFAASNVNSLIQRVAGNSLNEIDHLIAELQNVRDVLQTEGERVQREVAGYAHLSQAAMSSVKLITDSMARWKDAMGVVRSERA